MMAELVKVNRLVRLQYPTYPTVMRKKKRPITLLLTRYSSNMI